MRERILQHIVLREVVSFVESMRERAESMRGRVQSLRRPAPRLVQPAETPRELVQRFNAGLAFDDSEQVRAALEKADLLLRPAVALHASRTTEHEKVVALLG